MSTDKPATELTMDEAAQLVSETAEGVLAGQISSLVARGVLGEISREESFVRAVTLIRTYGDARVKEARNAH